jgi:AcrR family transcriptional regulator
MDRRVARTRALLHDALSSLIREKGYDAVSVTEILERANIGRSTFYVHFADKDELLVSAIRDLLFSVQSPRMPSSSKWHERILAFSLPVFEHVGRHLGSASTTIGTRGWAIVHEQLQTLLVDSIADDARREFKGRRKMTRHMSPDVLAQYVASTFVFVLNWWVAGRRVISPKEVDDLFRALVLPTLTAAWR